MNIWVDADACPVVIKEILFKAARRTKVQLTLVANQSMQTPPDKNIPNLTIQNINSGEVLFTDYLTVNEHFKSKFYRGSTPFIELSNNIWITIVHQRYYNNNISSIENLMYSYYFQIYDNKEILVNNKKTLHKIL